MRLIHEFGGNSSDFHSNRSYADIEADPQRGWSDYDRRSHTSTTGTQLEHAWEDLKDSVREGWEKAKAQFRKTF